MSKEIGNWMLGSALTLLGGLAVKRLSPSVTFPTHVPATVVLFSLLCSLAPQREEREDLVMVRPVGPPEANNG